jgi:internalin A
MSKKKKNDETAAEYKPLDGRMARMFPDVTLPPRLVEFFKNEADAMSGSRMWDLPYYSADSTVKLKFASKNLDEMWDEATGDYDDLRLETHFPIARAGDESQFVTVDLTNPALPVSFFDPESGPHLHDDSFDAFLAKLLKKGEKTPFEKMQKAYDKASKLQEDDKYAEALAIIEPAMAALPPSRMDSAQDEAGEALGAAWNIVGLCKKHLGDLEGGMKAFDIAASFGCDSAILNVMDHHRHETGNTARVIELGEKLREHTWLNDDYVYFWLRLYLGWAYITTNNETEAVTCYHQIVDGFKHSDPKKLDEAVEKLNEIDHDLARKIVKWVARQPIVVAPDEAQANRAWWDALPEKVKEGLAKQVGLEEGKAVSDDDVARVLLLEEVELKRMELTDISFVTRMKRLHKVELENNEITDLTPLASLPRLDWIDCGENQVATLEPLRPLRKVKRFSCGQNKLTSFAGLEGKTELEYLHAPQNDLTTLEALRDLPSLEELTIYENLVEDLSPLATCKRLKEISNFGPKEDILAKGLLALVDLPYLEEIDGEYPEEDIAKFRALRPGVWDEIGDDDDVVTTPPAEIAANRAWWDGLDGSWKKVLADIADGELDSSDDEQLVKLLGKDSIHLDEKELTDLAPIARFVKADYINLCENPFTDVAPLGGCLGARVVLLRETKITSVAKLATCVRMADLQLDDSPVTSLDGLETMKELRELDIERCPITDLRPISGLLEIRELHLDGSHVADLAPLATLVRLKEISLEQTRVTDLSPLAGCAALETIVCYGLPGLRGVVALKDLPDLRQITSHGSLSDEELAAFRAARPDVDID